MDKNLRIVLHIMGAIASAYLLGYNSSTAAKVMGGILLVSNVICILKIKDDVK